MATQDTKKNATIGVASALMVLCGPSQFVPNANPGFFDPVAPNGTTVLDPVRGSAASSRS